MSYIKNVGKSIGYAIPAIIEDKFKDLGQLSKMVANPKEFKTIFKDSIKDVLNDTSNDMNTEIIAPIKKVLDRSTKAAKTGKFFRSEKERTASAFEAFGGDFNMDFDFNTESLESSIGESTEATYENTNAIYESGVMQVATTTRATKSITSELSRLSSLTYELSKLQTELTRTQISEAGRYYASSLGFLGEMNDTMSALKNEMVALRMVSAPPDIFKGPNAQKYYEVLTASNFNMRSYFNYLGKKAKDSSAYSMLSMAGMMGSMMDPVEEVVKAMFSPITESKFGKRMQALNKAIAGSPLFVLRTLANKDFGDSFFGKGMSSLFKFLNVDYLDSEKHVSLKTDIRIVPWDAESKRSLVQVIPNLLSRILSAVKKEDFSKEGIIFDPNSGKYIKMQDLGNKMKETVDKATEYDEFSQNTIIKQLRESQTFSTDATERTKQEKSFNNQIYKLLDTARLAGGGNFDINKAIAEGKYTSPEEIKLAENLHKNYFSNLSVDKYNNMLELLQQHESRKENIIGTIKGLYTDSKDKFGTAERQFEGNLFDEISKKYFDIDNEKIKELRNNNGGNGDNSNNGGGGGNPPTNDSFFDKMRKLIDGSYLFTKLNGFLDTISDKFSKFIFGDDIFVGPKKSFFQTLKDGIKDKIDKFSEVFEETFRPLKTYFTQTLIPNISKAFSSVKEYLVDDIYKGIMGNRTLTGRGGIITNIKESIKEKYNKAKNYLLGTKDDQGNETTEGAFKKIYKSLGFQTIFDKFKDSVKSLSDVLKDNTEKLAKFFNKHLFEEGGLLKGLGDKIYTFFKDTTEAIKKEVLNPLKEFLVGDGGILTKAKENIKTTILTPIKDFFIDKDTGIFNNEFKLKFRNTFIQPLEDFFMGKGDNKQNIFKRLMGRLNKDLFFGKEKKYNVNGIQATVGGMFGDSNSFLYKFLFGTSSVDATGKVNKNTKGLIDNITEKGAGKYLIEKLSETIFKPFSKYLIGDEDKPGILRKFATYLDTNIANPIKSFLFGDENKEGALDKFKNSFNVFLFGDGTEKHKGVIGDYLKPATDFLKVELMDPFLDTMRKQWFDMKTFFKEGVLEPLMTSFDGLGTSLGIRISEMGKMGKNYFVDAFKTTLQVANESIGGMLSSSSKTLTEMMKENVLDPIKDTLSKIRTGIWNMIKGLITVPINAISAVTDKVKITDLLAGRGGHLSESQQDRLLAVYNKTAKVKMDKWGEQIDYFGNGNKPDEKKGFFSRFFDTFHTNRKLREEKEKAEEENKSNKINLDRPEGYKEKKTLKEITQKESANDIKNLSENSDKSTKSLSEILDTIKNPIPNITENIKDIKDSVTKYIREHSLTGGDKTSSNSTEDKEKSEEKKELKESRKEIKSTNGLLTDIRDGIDTLIFYASGGKGGSGSRGGANIRNRRFGGGSIGRILEGLILDPLGFAKNILEGGFKFIGQSLVETFKIITAPFVEITKSIGTAVRSMFNLISKAGGVIEGLSNLGGKLLTSIGNLTHDISIGIGTLLKDSSEIFGGIAKDLGTVLSTVVTSTMTVLEGVSEALKPLTEFMFKGIGTILGLMTIGVTESAKIAKGVMKTAGGFLSDIFGIKFGDQSGKMVKAVSIDGGMLTGISDVVRVFVVGGNLDSISNKVNSGGMDTSKLSSSNNSKESLKDVVNKNKVDLTRPNDYKKKKTSNSGGIKDSLVNMRDNLASKLRESREKLLLINSDKTVEHLAKIRESGKGLLDLLMLGLPMLISGIGSLITWIMASKAGSLLKGAGSTLAKGVTGLKSLATRGLQSASTIFGSSKLGTTMASMSKLKLLGVGALATGGSMIADNFMDNGVTKDVTTTGLDIVSGGATGFAVGGPIGAIVGALLMAVTNLDKIANIGKATWHFIAGEDAKFDKNGRMVKESKLSIFDRMFGNKAKFDEKGNVLEKQTSSGILDIFRPSFWWGDDKGLKNEKGQVIREAKKGIINSLIEIPLNFFKSISASVSNYMSNVIDSIKKSFSRIIANIKEIPNTIYNTISNIPNLLRDAINGLFTSLKDIFMSPFKYLGNFFGGTASEKRSGVINSSDIIKGNSLFEELKNKEQIDEHGFLFKNYSINEETINNLDRDKINQLLSSDKSLSNSTRDMLQNKLDSLNNPIKRAKGGIVLGKGTETSDSIDAKLSNNEYVLNANSVNMLGKGNLDLINALGNKITTSKKEYNEMMGNIFPWLINKKGDLVNFTLENIFPWLSNKAGKIINFTSEKIFPWLSETASSIGNSISNGVSSVWNGAKSMVSNIGEGIRSGYNKAIDYTSQTIIPTTVDKFQKVSGKFSEQAPQVVRRLMKDFGLKDYQAAAIMGNLGHESGGLKQMQEIGMKSGRGGLGWAQWTGPRRREFEQLAKETGLPIDSPELNYMMLKRDLTGQSKTFKPGNVIDKLKNTSDLKSAVYAFERGFEKSGDVDKAGNIIKTKHYQSRNNYAKQALQSLGNNVITGDDTQYDNKFVSESLSKSIGSDTPDGLKIKSKEATAGGKAKPGLYSLAKLIQNTVPGFKYFTAFNDGYHASQGYFSKKGNRNPSTHSKGIALDFTLSDASKSGEATQKIRGIFSKYGINGQVINEYARPSKGSTGGHIHVNFANESEASKFQSLLGGKGISEQLMGEEGKSIDSSNMSNNSVDYTNISSNNPETDKNIAITNASTDVKGLAIKESVDRGNNIAMENNRPIDSGNNLSKLEMILANIEQYAKETAKNTGETAKKDFTVKNPEQGDKKNINMFDISNKTNPYVSYVDNSKDKVINKRLEQANKIAQGQ